MQNEPPTKIYCPPREKHPPIVCDDAAPVRIYPADPPSSCHA